MLSDADREAAGLVPVLLPHEWRLIHLSLLHLRSGASNEITPSIRQTVTPCCKFVVTVLDGILAKLEKINAHHDAAEE